MAAAAVSDGGDVGDGHGRAFVVTPSSFAELRLFRRVLADEYKNAAMADVAIGVARILSGGAHFFSLQK